MECTVCNLETSPLKKTEKNYFNRLATKLIFSLKKVRIVGAEDLSKIR